MRTQLEGAARQAALMRALAELTRRRTLREPEVCDRDLDRVERRGALRGGERFVREERERGLVERDLVLLKRHQERGFAQGPDANRSHRGESIEGASRRARLGLAIERARAVREYLISRGGLDGARLDAVGFELSRPLVPHSDRAQSLAVNLRIEIFLAECSALGLANAAP